MIALIQRVSEASVTVEGEVTGAIGQGLLVLLGVEQGDDEAKADKLLHKVSGYRIFSDENGKMNLNVSQVGGSLLVVSQFTLQARIAAIADARLLANVIRQQMVEVIAAQRGIPAGRQHFKYATA